MTEADKVMNPQHLGRDLADIRIGIRIIFWLKIWRRLWAQSCYMISLEEWERNVRRSVVEPDCVFVEEVAELDLWHICDVGHVNKWIECGRGVSGDVVSRHRRLLYVRTHRVRRRQRFMVCRNARMTVGKVATNFGNFERSKSVAGRTNERWTHPVDRRNVIGKLLVGKSLVGTESTSTCNGRII